MKTNHPDFDEITQKRNREAKTYPFSSAAIWCDCCDGTPVHIGTKCPVCGFTYKTKHRKK